jgi:hypothetical protein
MAALGSTAAKAAAYRPDHEAADAAGLVGDSLPAGVGPVMFCVHDAKRGEVSILHGTDEVVVRDRQLVARILRAAGSRY